MKSFSVTAFFPEVKEHQAWQGVTIYAGSFAVAASRGLTEIRKRPGIAWKRITEVRVTIKLVAEGGRSK